MCAFSCYNMNKRTFMGVVEKDRLRKSFSKKKISLEHINYTVPTNPNYQKEPHATYYEVPLLKQVMQNFQRQVYKPVSFHQSVFNSANASKCFVHNNVLTVYCLNDSKALCAGCLYDSHGHKLHKVIPLAKAEVDMRQELTENISILKKTIGDLQQLIKKNDENIVKTQKEYPDIIDKLNVFYLKLHQKLVQRKNQHMELIAQNWERLRYSYNLTKIELSKIVGFIKTRMEVINQQAQKEKLLHYRNVTLELKKIREVVANDLAKGQQNRFINDIKHFADVTTIIDNYLVFTNLYSLEKETKEINKRSLSKSNPQTPSKSNKKIQVSKYLQKYSPRAQDVEAQKKPVYIPQQNEKSLFRNRHSKSDLLKKQQVQESMRMKSEQQLKKKNKQLHNSILQKSQKKIFRKELSRPSPTKSKKGNKSFR